MLLSYRDLQIALRNARENGADVRVKLNAKKEVLQAEYDRLLHAPSVTSSVSQPEAPIHDTTPEMATLEVATVSTIATAVAVAEYVVEGIKDMAKIERNMATSIRKGVSTVKRAFMDAIDKAPRPVTLTAMERQARYDLRAKVIRYLDAVGNGVTWSQRLIDREFGCVNCPPHNRYQLTAWAREFVKKH